MIKIIHRKTLTFQIYKDTYIYIYIYLYVVIQVKKKSQL